MSSIEEFKNYDVDPSGSVNDSVISEVKGSYKRSRGLALRREGESGLCIVLPELYDINNAMHGLDSLTCSKPPEGRMEGTNPNGEIISQLIVGSNNSTIIGKYMKFLIEECYEEDYHVYTAENYYNNYSFKPLKNSNGTNEFSEGQISPTLCNDTQEGCPIFTSLRNLRQYNYSFSEWYFFYRKYAKLHSLSKKK